MSVAVAQMPKMMLEAGPQPQADVSNSLLEALLASCQKPATNPPLPGFGRELVPYFVSVAQEKAASPAVPAKRNSNTSPQRVNRKATALAAAMVSAAKKSSGKTVNKPTSAKLTVAEAEKARAVKMASYLTSWAGPGFCVSPIPEKLPSPSSALLT